MKKITIMACVYTLLVGSAMFLESNALGQEMSYYGKCISDTNGAPTPNCNPESTSLEWDTGGAHCNYNPADSSECFKQTVNVTHHKEPVTWTSNIVDNPGQWVGSEEGDHWVYPPFTNPADCVTYIGLTYDETAQLFLCADYTIGSDTQTTVSGKGCIEIQL